MKIIITAKDTDNIIGLKEDIAMRLEDVVDIIKINVQDDNNKRNKYLELCQKNAIYQDGVVVKHRDIKYYPLALKLWFDSTGETQNTAILQDTNAKSIVEGKLSEVVFEKVDNSIE